MGRKAREGSVAPMPARTARSHDSSGARDLSRYAELEFGPLSATHPNQLISKMEGMILDRFLVDLT